MPLVSWQRAATSGSRSAGPTTPRPRPSSYWGGARSKHSGVVSAFGRLLVLDHGLDREAGRSLRRLFEERAEADYDELHGVDADDASAALDDAAMVVDDVTGVRDRASEPVQLGDHESVAGAACGHRFTQSPDGPGGCR